MANELTNTCDPKDVRIGVVVSSWNDPVTSRLLEGTLSTLAEKGVPDNAVDVARVPGAWEIPIAAQRFAQAQGYDAVICLGAVIRGETTHDEHINRAVSLAMSQIALEANKPVLLGLLTCQSLEQAMQRAGGTVGNKGSECAESALEMIGLLKNVPAGNQDPF
jgi:6,7-dimethyl-8-ribityllumazine synthase